MKARLEKQKVVGEKENDTGSCKIFPGKRTIPLHSGTENNPAHTRKAFVDDKELVSQIVAASSCEEVMNYLCNDFSNRSLDLTMEALKIDSENPWVWRARREILEEIEHDMHGEYKYISSLPDDGYTWAHRLWLAKKLGTCTMLEEFVRMKMSACKNPNEYTPWHVMEQLSVELGSAVTHAELSLTSEVLSADKENTFAWRYKLFIISKPGTTADELKYEAGFVKGILSENKMHEYAWTYLQKFAPQLGADAVRDVLKFVTEILFDDGENKYAWTCRQRVAERRDDILGDELKYTEDFLYKKSKNIDAWAYRRWLLEMIEDYDSDLDMSFTRKLLSEDVKNEFAWYQRQWVVLTFEGWEEDELAYCDQLLEVDIDNESVWTQRSFVVMRNSMDVLDPLRINEVKYGTRIIFTKPENVYAWLHLQSLYLKSDFDDSNLDNIFEFVLSDGISGVIGIKDNVTRNTESYANALEALPYLLSCGYKPSYKVAAVISDLCSIEESISGVSDDVTPIMQFMDGVRLHNCEWFIEMTDGLDYARIMRGVTESQ